MEGAFYFRRNMKKVRSDYRICAYCGASLDPGEKCDCEGARKKRFYIWQIRFDD